MSKLLEEIYWLSNDREFFKHSRNKASNSALADFVECEKILTKELTGENLDTFIKSVNAVDAITANTAVDNFILGMRVGSQFALELFGKF